MEKYNPHPAEAILSNIKDITTVSKGVTRRLERDLQIHTGRNYPLDENPAEAVEPEIVLSYIRRQLHRVDNLSLSSVRNDLENFINKIPEGTEMRSVVVKELGKTLITINRETISRLSPNTHILT
jgi:hypothetical protein